MLTAVVCVLLLARPDAGADAPYGPGRSSVPIGGLQVELDVPRELTPDKPASLVVILHGAGGSATGMAGALGGWARDGYVVCAPKSAGRVWEPPDLEKLPAIIEHLLEKLPIDPKRLHVVGFSNGSFNLHPIAFHEKLQPQSATWVAGGHMGGPPPKWAKTRLATLCLAGVNDANVRVARQTTRNLTDKVRSTELRLDPGKGHEWPDGLMPYFKWWMGVAEGRYDPAADMNFDWGADVAKAQAAVAGKKKGGVLVWLWRKEDTVHPLDVQLQSQIFMDAEIRFLGAQLQAVRLEAGTHATAIQALHAAAKIKKPVWPTLVVLDPKGKVKKVFAGKVTTRKLASALRRVAPKKKLPDAR